MTSSALSSMKIPHIHLLADRREARDLFVDTLEQQHLQNSISYTVHEASLSQLDPQVTFDLVVSPANSYGILDGGFDDAISRAWSPAGDYNALTRAVQAQLYDFSLGYLPPGQSFIARIPSEFKGKGRYEGHGWGCKYIALCPTMRVPQNVEWDREIVYECIWSLLNAIKRHNRAAEGGDRILSILMTPLATGAGGLPIARWARQTVLAMEHFLQAERHPEVWSRIDWLEAQRSTDEVSETH